MVVTGSGSVADASTALPSAPHAIFTRGYWMPEISSEASVVPVPCVTVMLSAICDPHVVIPMCASECDNTDPAAATVVNDCNSAFANRRL